MYYLVPSFIYKSVLITLSFEAVWSAGWKLANEILASNGTVAFANPVVSNPHLLWMEWELGKLWKSHLLKSQWLMFSRLVWNLDTGGRARDIVDSSSPSEAVHPTYPRGQPSLCPTLSFLETLSQDHMALGQWVSIPCFLSLLLTNAYPSPCTVIWAHLAVPLLFFLLQYIYRFHFPKADL